jgi:ferritin-like metal-binding protein YciE
MRAGSEVSEDATQEMYDAATHPDLRRLLDEGARDARTWAQRIDRAIEDAGRAGDPENPIVHAHHEVSRDIRGRAADASSRNLDIIASGQLALHYWIASFGTASAHATTLGMRRTASDFLHCVEKANSANQQQTALAQRMLG